MSFFGKVDLPKLTFEYLSVDSVSEISEALPAGIIPASTPTVIEIDAPYAIAVRKNDDGQWRIETPIWGSSLSLKLQEAHNRGAASSENRHKSILYVTIWAAVLGDVLTRGEMVPEDAQDVLNHIAQKIPDNFTKITFYSAKGIGKLSVCVLETLPQHLRKAQPFLAIAYWEIRELLCSYQEESRQLPYNVSAIAKLLETKPQKGAPKHEWLDSAATIDRDHGSPDIHWQNLCDRLRQLESKGHQQASQKRGIRPGPRYKPPNSTILKELFVGDRFGTPHCLSQLYDRYKKVDLSHDMYFPAPIMARICIDKAQYLKDDDKFKQWWIEDQKQSVYDYNKISLGLMLEIGQIMRDNHSTAEQQAMATCLSVLWEFCTHTKSREVFIYQCCHTGQNVGLEGLYNWDRIQKNLHPYPNVLREMNDVRRSVNRKRYLKSYKRDSYLLAQNVG